MPGSSAALSGEQNGSSRNFKLNESTFLASLMHKKMIAADRFIEAHPHFDGRGVVIAIFDSGVDPAADGLQVTTDGKPKILDVLDCTGNGDIDTSTVVKADANGCIRGASGASLVVNSSWNNPTGEWHVGYKLVYELFTSTLTSRLKKERKSIWDVRNQEAIAKAVKHLDEFEKKHPKTKDANLKKDYEYLKNRVSILRKQAESYDDKGPVIDAVVWHDGELWRVALDTQSLEDEPGVGKLSDFVPLTNYRKERKYGIFSKLDACTFVTNVYVEGNLLSIVTESSPHGTHVAGITAAFHPKEPLLNGVAPGAQLISCKIGDSRLGSKETGTSLTQAVIAAAEHKCDLVNMSYGEPTLLLDYGRFVNLVNEMVYKYRTIFVSSAGNNGPGLSTVGTPSGTTSSIIGFGAYVSPAMAALPHCVVEAPSEELEYPWSNRGPTVDGDLGVPVIAPGGAVATVPTRNLQRRMLMNGISMSSSTCGGIALLISGMKAEGISVSPYSVCRAIEDTCFPIGHLLENKLSGQGLMQVDKAYEYIQKCPSTPCAWYQIKINQASMPSPTSQGIYLRESSYSQESTEVSLEAQWTVQVEPKFHEDVSNFGQLVPFEESIVLHSTDKGVVRAPDCFLLTYNGCAFNIIVDSTNLTEGLHYYEVYGIDYRAPWRGPLFRIPVTITKPKTVKNPHPLVSYQGTSYQPGHIDHRYMEVPNGVTNREEEVEENEGAASGSKRTKEDNEGGAINGSKRITQCWTEEDDIVLAKSWVEYSTDLKIGTNQNSGVFWRKISQCVNEQTARARTTASCKARWQKISKELGQYIAAVRTARTKYGSGGRKEDIRNGAIKIFTQNQNRHFILHHIYPILRHVSKFRSHYVPEESDAQNTTQFNSNDQSSEGSAKRSRLNEGDAYSISTNESTHDSEDPPTPISRSTGMKAANSQGKQRRITVAGDEGMSSSINDFVAVEREWLKFKRLELAEKERARKSKCLRTLLNLGPNATPQQAAIRDKLMTELYGS